MSDMLVKLYALPERAQDTDKDYEIIRPMAPDKFRVVEWVKEHSGLSAAGECDVCFARPAVSCFIATRGVRERPLSSTWTTGMPLMRSITS